MKTRKHENLKSQHFLAVVLCALVVAVAAAGLLSGCAGAVQGHRDGPPPMELGKDFPRVWDNEVTREKVVVMKGGRPGEVARLTTAASLAAEGAERHRT